MPVFLKILTVTFDKLNRPTVHIYFVKKVQVYLTVFQVFSKQLTNACIQLERR